MNESQGHETIVWIVKQIRKSKYVRILFNTHEIERIQKTFFHLIDIFFVLNIDPPFQFANSPVIHNCQLLETFFVGQQGD